jgi:signal transduction histidine kinase
MKIALLLYFLITSAFAGDWEFRTFTSLKQRDNSKWQLLKNPSTAVAREYRGFIEYRNTLEVDNTSEELSIYLGKIGDADKVFLNDVQIGQTGEFPPNFTYNMDTERNYYIPKTLLKTTELNEIRILVYVQFLVNKGFNPANFEISTVKALDHKKYVQELSNNLSKIVIPLLCLVLAAISFPFFAPRLLWRNQVLIFMLSLSSFILGICRGRLGYHFFDMLPVYKTTLVSSVTTIWIVAIYSTKYCSKPYKALLSLVASALITAILCSENLMEAASVGRIWFHISPFFILISIYTVFKSSTGKLPLKVGLITLLAANINDNLNDLRFISTTPLLQVGLGTFIFLLIFDQILSLKRSWETFFRKENDLEVEAKVGRQSIQLAHDIRSPLEALKASKDEFSILPEDGRRSVLIAINRIEEIAYNLLKSRTYENAKETPNHLISQIEQVLIEKRMQYRNYQYLEILATYDEKSFASFSKISLVTFKRIVSNIITNGAEATMFKGIINICLTDNGSFSRITITDNGPGIAHDFEKQLFEKGFTTKADGNGLGLHSAKTEIEAVGGKIFIQRDKVTSVVLDLPKAETPKNFPESINLSNIKTVIILDDDANIHEVWRKRFASSSIQLEHFFSASSLLEQYSTVPEDKILLSDYELLGEEINGLECIKQLSSNRNSILVTARYDEPHIQKETQIHNIKILPKCMASIVPIQSVRVLNTPIILIDDDELVHLSWKRSAYKANREIKTYFTIEDFMAENHLFELSTGIYVDSNLKGNIKGEIESEKIFNKGFSNIYLATGYSPESISKPAWIKEIYSKNIPELWNI